MLAAAALRAAAVLFESAVPLATLSLLALVEALATTVPTVAVATPGGSVALPVTEALAAAVVLELARRLAALNAAG